MLQVKISGRGGTGTINNRILDRVGVVVSFWMSLAMFLFCNLCFVGFLSPLFS